MTQRNRWVRSWLPEDHPLLATDRPRVTDHIERFPIESYDYRPLIEDHVKRFPGQGLIHVDWDTAFGIETRDAFERAARASADGVLVAPVRIYPDSTALPETVWNHRLPSGPVDEDKPILTGDMLWRWVTSEDEKCALFGFGMVYIDWGTCHQFLRNTQADGPQNDFYFSKWYYENYGLTRITWDIIPVHLHWQSAFEE
jgi:hypothetical protein